MVVLDLVILLVSALVAFFDLRIRKIPNWLIGIGLICGFLLNSIQGAGHLVQSITGFMLGIAVLIVPFALGWIGAGDVKLFGVVGALLGVQWLPRVFFYSAVVAGLLAIGYLAFGFAKLTRMKELWLDIKTGFLSMGNVLPDSVTVRSRETGASVPWGVAFAGGTMIAYFVDPHGQWAGF